ncbi:unnamed protein product [Diplocarpon coronariae]|uniref:Uncharacterized protein n=1 Tax=Diplocarpon coronariae TaxID=2795749 RepID=A0A218ZCY6_9HELO|nr:hypothetical protein B2J93_8346 [Marssonina coronariae]
MSYTGPSKAAILALISYYNTHHPTSAIPISIPISALPTPKPTDSTPSASPSTLATPPIAQPAASNNHLPRRRAEMPPNAFQLQALTLQAWLFEISGLWDVVSYYEFRWGGFSAAMRKMRVLSDEMWDWMIRESRREKEEWKKTEKKEKKENMADKAAEAAETAAQLPRRRQSPEDTTNNQKKKKRPRSPPEAALPIEGVAGAMQERQTPSSLTPAMQPKNITIVPMREKRNPPGSIKEPENILEETKQKNTDTSTVPSPLVPAQVYHESRGVEILEQPQQEQHQNFKPSRNPAPKIPSPKPGPPTPETKDAPRLKKAVRFTASALARRPRNSGVRNDKRKASGAKAKANANAEEDSGSEIEVIGSWSNEAMRVPARKAGRRVEDHEPELKRARERAMRLWSEVAKF